VPTGGAIPPLPAPVGRVVLSGLLNNHAQAAAMAYRAQGLMLDGAFRWKAGPRS
jgi:ribosomal protein L11 methylase PrmA